MFMEQNIRYYDQGILVDC